MKPWQGEAPSPCRPAQDIYKMDWEYSLRWRESNGMRYRSSIGLPVFIFVYMGGQKGAFVLVFIPQSTQKTGCSTTVLVSFIHYWPFANCFIASRLGQTNIWHKLVPFIVSQQCICSNIMFVFFLPCNSLYSVQADQYSAAVVCQCSAIFHSPLRNLIMHCPTQIGPECWWARRSFIT